MAENAGLRGGFGSNLRGAKARNEARKRDGVSCGESDDAARKRLPRHCQLI
jgi:hypothetical protein